MGGEDALGRLVDISFAGSRSDWAALRERKPVPKGTRQERFTPTEVILCLAAMLRVDHRRFGSMTNHLAPTPIPELARLFKRPASSVLAKMANLDGSRPHGGKAEKEAASILLASAGAGLFAAYSEVLRAARAEGVSQEELPDFLDAEQVPVALLGQEELSDAEIERDVEKRVLALSRVSGLSERITERLLVGVARVGQHAFAQQVHANCGSACVFCGLAPGADLHGKGLLRASHIKPWKDSGHRERLDPANGLSACPDHDAAFDAGLVYLTESLSVELSPDLSARVDADDRFREAFGQPPIGARLVLPENAIRPGTRFVRWHREKVARVA